MLLRDIQIIDRSSVGEVATELERAAIQVAELYLSFVYKRLLTHGPAKVVVEFCPMRTGEQPVADGTDVLIVRYPCDISAMNLAPPDRRKRFVLDSLHKAMLWVADTYAWRTDMLVAAHAASLAAGLTYRARLLLRGERHPSLPVKATCECVFTDTAVDVWVLVTDMRNTELGRRHAFTTFLDPDLVRHCIERIEWYGHGKHCVRTIPGRGMWGEEPHIVNVADLLSIRPATR